MKVFIVPAVVTIIEKKNWLLEAVAYSSYNIRFLSARLLDNDLNEVIHNTT